MENISYAGLQDPNVKLIFHTWHIYLQYLTFTQHRWEAAAGCKWLHLGGITCRFGER